MTKKFSAKHVEIAALPCSRTTLRAKIVEGWTRMKFGVRREKRGSGWRKGEAQDTTSQKSKKENTSERVGCFFFSEKHGFRVFRKTYKF